MSETFVAPAAAPAPRRDPLARSLQMALTVALALSVAVGLAVILLVGELGSQVRRWEAVEVLDDRREQLHVAMNGAPRALETDTASSALSAFDSIDKAVDALTQYDEDAALAHRLETTVAAARTLYLSTERARKEAAAEIAEVRRIIDKFYEFSAQWSRAIDDQHDDATRQAAAAEVEAENLNRLMQLFTEAKVGTARIKRDLEAISRYNETPGGSVEPLREIYIDEAQIPPPCAGAGNANALCRPSSARVHATLARLNAAEPARRDIALADAYQAVKAYERAIDIEFRRLSDVFSVTIDKSRTARRAMAEANLRKGGVARLNRVIADIATRLDQVGNDPERDLAEINRSIRGQIVQLRFRAQGVSAASGLGPQTLPEINVDIVDMVSHWNTADAALRQRADRVLTLDMRLAELARQIGAETDAVRRNASLWVQVIATATITSAIVLALFFAALLWAGQRLVTEPLAQVTSTLLALSYGDPVPPVALRRRLLGFDRLGYALERLRRANLERESLVQETLLQRMEIEENLRTLAETTREMERQARQDALTGLPNRRHADDFLSKIDQSPTGNSSQSDFTLMHIDVDRFKEINDTLGHEAGDHILRHVAGLLTKLTGPQDVTFRIGGDEFLVARPGAIPDEDTTDLADQIIDAMNRPVEYEGHLCRIGASIGIAHGRDGGYDGRDTLVIADIALYEAKKSGRNRYAYFSPSLQDRTVHRKELADRLLEAIENDEFVPFYQPQFFSETLRLRGVETLCRWNHPERGILTPGEFLLQVDEPTIVGRIDQLLLRRAAKDLRYLRERGHVIPKISFNITTDRLMHAGLAEALVGQIDPETRVAVELLESMSLDSLSESVRWAIDSLKEQGIGIEIDDFGSCRASIAGLIAVGPHAMKIDGSIVAPITVSEQHLKLVKAIVDIGAALGIEVVAERTETDEHVRILRESGCSVLQGYALARPMAAPDLADFLSAMDDVLAETG